MDSFGSSILEQWTWILWAIEGSDHPHKRVLDVGAGHGKGAVLMREYLNVKPEEIDAIEPNADYIKALDRIYDRAWCVTAEMLGETLWERYDTVLMADVIEHMPFGVGFELISTIPGQVIISTPVDALSSDNEGVPPFEQHVSQWRASHFQQLHRFERLWHWPVGGAAPKQYIVRLGPLS